MLVHREKPRAISRNATNGTPILPLRINILATYPEPKIGHSGWRIGPGVAESSLLPGRLLV